MSLTVCVTNRLENIHSYIGISHTSKGIQTSMSLYGHSISNLRTLPRLGTKVPTCPQCCRKTMFLRFHRSPRNNLQHHWKILDSITTPSSPFPCLSSKTKKRFYVMCI